MTLKDASIVAYNISYGWYDLNDKATNMEAIETIVNAETINSITKRELVGIIRYLLMQIKE